MIVDIHDIGTYGEGVGTSDGLRVFVDGALPGERVRVRLTLRKKNYARGVVEEWLERSPERSSPPCPYFGKCGGCQLQHLSYEGQLRFKTQRVKECLRRIGGLELDVAPCIPSPQQLGYRNKIQLPVKERLLGLYSQRSHDLVPIERCLIHGELGENVFQQLRSYLPPRGLRHVLIRSSEQSKQALLIVVSEGSSQLGSFAHKMMGCCPELVGVVENIKRTDDNVILGQEWQTLAGRDWLEEEFCGLRFRIHAGAFMQVNASQAEALYRHALAQLELTGQERVLDAYCGVGTMTLLAAQNATSVHGIECVAQAIDQAEYNAEINGLSNTSFQVGRVEDLLAELPKIDSVILNPPRKGCEASVLHALAQQEPGRIVYVSCDPATLARDAKLLCSLGYQVTCAQPFDMFPQSTHVETVLSFQR